MSILGIAVLPSVVTSHAGNTGGARVTTTVYVSPHFEVRDHDQPVKYVFKGETRVARVTGSFSANARIQRWRLQTGWNLCGVAVDGALLPSEPGIVSVFLWNPITQTYAAPPVGQPLKAGDIVWVKAGTNFTASLMGDYAESASVTAGVGGTYVCAGLEAWRLPLPAGVAVWRHDAGNSSWHAIFANALAPVTEFPPDLASGEAIYVHTDKPVELVPNSTVGVAYYHQDHLGSSSVVTDAGGALAEETAYYPFGAVRHEARLQRVEAHYEFTQKERDRESGLHDFGHRYYHAGLGRWLSPDPLGEKGGGMNLYAYVNQNPLKHYDPDGAEIKVMVDNKKKPTNYQITLKAVYIDVSSKKFTQAEMVQHAAKLKSTIENSFKGKKGKISWSTQVDLRAVKDWSEVKKDDHVFRIVDNTRTGAAGLTRDGGMLMDIRVARYTQKHPSEVDQTKPENKHYTLENYITAEGTAAHEFGHIGGLSHDDSFPNLMQSGNVRKYDNKDIMLQQIETMWKAYEAGKLNQREPILDDLTKSK